MSEARTGGAVATGTQPPNLNAQGIPATGRAGTNTARAGRVAGAFTPIGPPSDPELVRRIRRAYRAAYQASPGAGESMWADIGRRQAAIHKALLAEDDSLEAILREPGKTDLFFGFHSLFARRTAELRAASNEQKQSAADALCHEILRLCEAVGLRRIRNPESKAEDLGKSVSAVADVEAAFCELDEMFGTRVEFPNPYPDEFGILTSRGIASYRAIHALYQVFRLRQLTDVYGPRILEIGAGLGRTAGYAHTLGLREYTIVDLPMTNVAQASFLGQTLGPDVITLFGEQPHPGRLRIVTPEWLRASSEIYNVVLNVDSMTEMDRRFADEYAAFIQARAACFLSINHEANRFRVSELAPLQPMFVQRFPYWMREGYTEELYVNLKRSAGEGHPASPRVG